ncbi:MAG: DUF2283 domain-containing protein [Chloroflexi bacterium]|nr:DUF2283 domain-containing protein [Chloroflexota bacterium]
MKIQYDREVDAAYIYLKERPAQVTTVRLSEDVAVDFGPGEEVVGIEILDASKHLGLDPKRPVVELVDLNVA